MANKKYMSTSRLDSLWRQAILKIYNSSCILCGNTFVDELECHHIVKRRNKILRHDLWNGVPVCKWGCHQEIDSPKGILFLHNRDTYKGDFDYLSKYKVMTFKQYLVENELTENEFLKMKHDEIKEVLDESTTQS